MTANPRTLLPVFVLAVVLLFAAPQAPALAHAELVDADPAGGGTLDEVPERVRLEFDEPVEAEFDPLEVSDAEDRRVDLGDARVEPDAPNALAASLGEMSPGGTYTVRYRTTSADGDPVEDTYTFYLSSRAEAGAVSLEPDTPQPEPPEEEGFGRAALYGALALAGVLALSLAVRRGR